ncbi:MAG TPA: rRNA maturation RNase YbeY, partial [Polyangiaceae bacterium]|nr:rRNA maturation RNase YbeY [Polyangiaceae bacterium]
SSASIEADWLLGDVVISLDTAARQADGRKRPLLEEVRWLLAHGVLHLCGYDHASPSEKRTMVNLTRRLVRAAQAVTPSSDAREQDKAPTTIRSHASAKSSNAKSSNAKSSKLKPSKLKPSKAKSSKVK